MEDNLKLQKENEQLLSVVQETSYIRELHLKVLDKCKKAISMNEKLRLQLEAQETMIKDLVG